MDLPCKCWKGPCEPGLLALGSGELAVLGCINGCVLLQGLAPEDVCAALVGAGAVAVVVGVPLSGHILTECAAPGLKR